MTPRLVSLTEDLDAEVRASAVRALGERAPGVLAALNAGIDSHLGAQVEPPSSLSLAQIQREIRAILVDPLLRALRDPVADVRCAGVVALGALLDESLVHKLVICLGDPASCVREAAAALLGHSVEQPPRVLITALNDPNPEVRRLARGVFRAIGGTSVPALTLAMADNNPAHRRVAADMLTELGWVPTPDAAGLMYWLALGDGERAAAMGPAVVPELVAALSHQDDEIRSLAAHALVLLGVESTPRLIAALDDPTPGVRASAKAILVEIGSGCVPALIECLRDEHSETLQHLACEALGEIGDARAARPLAEALCGPDPKLKMLAASSLGSLGGAVAVQALITGLTSPAWGVPQAAAAALARIGDARAVDPLRAVLVSPQEWVRRASAEALGALADLRTVPSLVLSLNDSTPTVRRAAAGALGDIAARQRMHQAPTEPPDPGGTRGSSESSDRDHGAIRTDGTELLPLVTALARAAQDSDATVRTAAAEALGKTGHPAAVEALVSSLGDRSPKVRDEGTSSLLQIGEASIEPLLAVLASGPRDQSCIAAEALGQIGDQRALVPLVNALRHSIEWVRRSAALALGSLGDARAIPHLVQLTEDESERVRSASAVALGMIRDESSTPALVALLDDESVRVRINAAHALGRAGAVSAVPHLVGLLAAHAPNIRMAAAEALVVMSTDIAQNTPSPSDSHLVGDGP